MAQKVCKCGIKKKKGYLYFVGKNGHIYETKMARGKKRGGGRKIVYKSGVKKKKKDYLYFVDKKGDVSMAKLVRGGRRKKRRR